MVYRRKENLFDRGVPSEENKIEIIIQSQYFNDYIEEYEVKISKLFSLARLSFIELTLLPYKNSNDKFRALTEKHQISIPKYEEKHLNGSTILFSTQDYELIVLNGELEYWKNKNYNNGQISVPDMQTINHIVPDYFIMDETDPYLTRREGNIRKVSINQFFEEIRILLVHHRIFYVNFNHQIKGQLIYYNYRLMSKFSKLFEPNRVNTKPSNDSTGLQHSYYSSLTNRLYLLCKSIDEIEFNCYKTPNNDTIDDTIYHLGYFIMLLTGSFENIAGVIKDTYSIELKHPKDLSIRVYNRKETIPFLKSVKHYNNDLVSYLLGKEVKVFINFVYEIRDALQHRDYFQGIGSSSPSGKNPNLLWIPYKDADSYTHFSKDFQERLGIEHEIEDNFLFDMHKFARTIFDYSVVIFNSIMEAINVNLYAKLSEPNKKVLDKKIKEFIDGDSYTMRIGKDSLYFN
ncbi:hypothetical protein SAMN05421676_103113 [Salinibacillus kushneri]|uniref:Uncharacterized protein n=1 Tax=Salinibacillus kushneri TaxID=237682 RepID=A0A1I0CCP6_9BACI|nr:hypothetical protein SAMN05421676_103113 [Salinibacillus kushneri]